MLKPLLPIRVTFLLTFCLISSLITLSENVHANSYTPPFSGIQVQQIQGNQYNFTLTYPKQDSDDLVFWILPDGTWRYGNHINHYFESNTYQFGAAYVLKKNDTDFGIASYPIPTFSVNASSNGTNTNIGTQSLQVSSSWSASRNNWVYAILTFTNTTAQTINNGTLSLSYPNNIGYNDNPSNTIIPYNWANPSTSITNGNQTNLNWTFGNIDSGEQKHLYVAFDVANNAQHMAQLTASITSNEITTSEDLKLETRNYPHDPNFVRIEASYGAEYDEYEYCYQYSEKMIYTVGFQNEGAAPAMNINIEIDIEEDFYQINNLDIIGSSDIESITNFTYNSTTGIITAHFEEIMLPGLNDPEKIVSFQESTGYISFEIQTKCEIEEELSVDADIVFIAEDGTLMPAINTNTVNAVIGELSSPCIFCIPSSNDEETALEDVMNEGEENKQSLNHKDLLYSINLSPNPCKDFLTINYTTVNDKQTINIKVLDITGKQRKDLLNTSVTKGKHTMMADVSDLESGIYLVNIQIGDQNESYKLVKW